MTTLITSNLITVFIPLIFIIGLILLIIYLPAKSILKYDYMKQLSHNHILNTLQTELDISKLIKIKITNTSKFNLYIEDMEFILFNMNKPLIINKFSINCHNITIEPGATHEISVDIKPIYFDKKQGDVGLYEFLNSVKKFNLIIHKHNSYYTNLSFYLSNILSKPFKKNKNTYN